MAYLGVKDIHIVAGQTAFPARVALLIWARFALDRYPTSTKDGTDMPNAMQHLYVTAHGEYSEGPYLGEAAQIGFRFGFVPVLTSPAMGETFELPENGEPVPEFGTQAGTNGTLSKTWTARVGPTGSEENWGASEQAATGDIVHTLLVALKAYQNNDFRWTSVKQAPVDSLGKTIGTASTFTFTAPATGAGTAGLPAQCAVAVSSRANIVGRSGRGRFYVPALADTLLASDGSISGTPKGNMTTAFKAFIDSMQGVIGGLSLNRALYVVTSAGKATAVRPAEVRVGNLVDTIGTRRAQADETYQVLPL